MNTVVAVAAGAAVVAQEPAETDSTPWGWIVAAAVALAVAAGGVWWWLRRRNRRDGDTPVDGSQL